MGNFEGVAGDALMRAEARVDDVTPPDASNGDTKVGDAAFRRTRFAFCVRNFSSSSEEVVSEFFASKSMLIATDSMLLRELPKDGARLMPGGQSEDEV